MLTIPDAIKALFKTDGVYKNFRAHFPNGERADITNADIVRESLKFTESVCSDSVMRFGGCERSVLEFETVGVGNILGAAMECGIEIDTTSLSGAQITAIQADPGDGTLVLAAASDIGRGYYRVPLGRFNVASCPRDHQTTSHRQITAYSPRPWRMNRYLAAKLDWMTCAAKVGMDPELEVLALLGCNEPAVLTEMGWTRTKTLDWWSGPVGRSAHTLKSRTISVNVDVITTDGETVNITATGTMQSQAFSVLIAPDVWKASSSGLCAVDMKGFPAADAAAFLRRELEELRTVDYAATDLTFGPGAVSTFADLMRWTLQDCVATLRILDYPIQLQVAVLEGDVPALSMRGLKISPSLAKGITYNKNDQSGWYLHIPETVTVTITPQDHPGDAVTETFATPLSPAPEIYAWLPPAARTGLSMMLSKADEVSYSYSGNTQTARNWYNAFDPANVVKGWMELGGSFLPAGRGDPPEPVTLTPDTPAETISPGEYASCWWSEYDPEPVGQVAYSTGDTQMVSGLWGSQGYGSIYDLSDNEMIGSLEDPTPALIDRMISQRMLPGLLILGRYAPAELSMPAWPWLEAGDTVQVTAEDGTEVLVGIFRREMSGVQMLWDNITAPGGELEADDE